MSNPYFRFRQFTVWHDKCAMKVGTDGVLLGAWAPVGDASLLLDVGTGTGLVALMLAQRSREDAHVVALEIDEAAARQAEENVARSLWKERIEVVRGDFIAYRPTVKFDVIVSNPPYFVNSLNSPNQQRNMARHNTTLTYENLLEGVSHLLTDEGIFSVVIPMDAADKVKSIASICRLHAIRQLNVKTKPDGISKRALIAFSFRDEELVTDELLTEISRHHYSQEYITLTRDFYWL